MFNVVVHSSFCIRSAVRYSARCRCGHLGSTQIIFVIWLDDYSDPPFLFNSRFLFSEQRKKLGENEIPFHARDFSFRLECFHSQQALSLTFLGFIHILRQKYCPKDCFETENLSKKCNNEYHGFTVTVVINTVWCSNPVLYVSKTGCPLVILFLESLGGAQFIACVVFTPRKIFNQCVGNHKTKLARFFCK